MKSDVNQNVPFFEIFIINSSNKIFIVKVMCYNTTFMKFCTGLEYFQKKTPRKIIIPSEIQDFQKYLYKSPQKRL